MTQHRPEGTDRERSDSSPRIGTHIGDYYGTIPEVAQWLIDRYGTIDEALQHVASRSDRISNNAAVLEELARRKEADA